MKLLMDIECHVLPTEVGNLLVPSSLVLDELTIDVGEDRNHLSWRSRSIHLMKYSEACYQKKSSKPPFRAVVLRSIKHLKGLPFYALSVEGISHQVTVNQDTLLKDDKETCALTYCAAKVGSLDCLVPDFTKVERGVLNMVMLQNAVNA